SLLHHDNEQAANTQHAHSSCELRPSICPAKSGNFPRVGRRLVPAQKVSLRGRASSFCIPATMAARSRAARRCSRCGAEKRRTWSARSRRWYGSGRKRGLSSPEQNPWRAATASSSVILGLAGSRSPAVLVPCDPADIPAVVGCPAGPPGDLRESVDPHTL